MSITALNQTDTDPIRDLATEKGSYTMVKTTVGEYLSRLGLYDSSRKEGTWDASLVSVPFQRAAIPIQKNAIKQRMFRDLLRGGTLPPTVLYFRGDENRDVVIDGLQRTHVLTEAVKALSRREQGEKATDFAEDEISEMKKLNQEPLSVDNLLNRPVIFQRWQDLAPEEVVRLFIVLNAGQQKVSPRHLLEVMVDDLRKMFESWGIPLLTERQEKEQPARRTRKQAAPPPLGLDGEPEITPATAGITHFRYEYLIDGLHGYVGRDPHVKTNKVIQESGDSARLPLEERITEIGSEVCRADFTWACKELNDAIKQKYGNTPKWRLTIQNSDNFFIPLMAALGEARTSPGTKGALEDRKSKLLEIIRDSSDEDPLSLVGDNNSQSLTYVLNSIRSNIGRKQRSVVFIAFKRYFRAGTEDISYPIDWREALIE